MKKTRKETLELTKSALRSWVTLEDLAKAVRRTKSVVRRAVLRLEGVEVRKGQSDKKGHPGRKPLQYRCP